MTREDHGSSSGISDNNNSSGDGDSSYSSGAPAEAVKTGLQYAALQDSMRLADLAANGESELADRSGAERWTMDGGLRAEPRTVTTDVRTRS